MHLLRYSRAFPLQLGAALVLLGVVPASLAALGGDVSTLASEQSVFRATFVATQSNQFSVHSLTTPAGVHIRQYAGSSGRVFAVAWDGPVLPNLETLLGSSYAAYVEGQRQRGRGVRIQTPALVVESAGMMRAFYGKALLPKHLPDGISARDIQ